MNFRIFISCIFCIWIFIFEVKSQDFTISGIISDAASGESLIGVNVYNPEKNTGAISNEFGFFSLKISPQIKTLLFSYTGYKTDTLSLVTYRDTFIHINLKKGLDLEEVEITAQIKAGNEINETSVIQIPMKMVYTLPEFLGENDIIHSLQLMPGIKSGGEGKAEIYIRGGSPDQNLILLDDVPLYHISHFGGFLSTFNSDAIKDFRVYKGGFPARYGSRLSSVVDIRMKDGNLKNYNVTGSLGLLSTKIMVDGPIKKDRSSFLISFRKNTLPVFRMFFNMNLDYRFYDFNSKLNYKINQKNRLYLSIYSGDDKVLSRINENTSGITEKSERFTSWGNIAGSLRWNKILTNKIFVNTILGYVNYNYNEGFKSEIKHDTVFENIKNLFTSNIKDFFIKIAPEYYITSKHVLRFGGELIHHSFIPGNTEYEYESGSMGSYDLNFNNESISSLEWKLYLEGDLDLKEWLGTNIGVHYSNYIIDGESYSSLEPRVLVNFRITPEISFKSSYSEMQQYVHLLSYNGVGMPSDFWMPSTVNIPPQKSRQYSVGFEYFFSRKYKLSIESYRKEMSNLITFRPGESFLKNNDSWEEKVLIGGNGLAEGVEVLFRKNSGKTTGWLSLELSKSDRSFNELMNGENYPFKYDRRFETNLVLTHSINENVSISAVWKYGSGYPITLPEKKFNSFGEIVYVYSDINSFRMRDYHRLDLGINFVKQMKWGERKWSISVMNVYNRQNPYYYYFDYEYVSSTTSGSEGFIFGSVKGNLKLFQQSLIPFLPTASFSFKF